MKSKWDFYTIRRWSLYLGGLLGFIVVGSANLVYDRDVNPAIYVLLAGMLGLPDVLFRTDQLKMFGNSEKKPPEKKEDGDEKAR